VRARLASGNPHKLVELRRALPEWEFELVENRDFPPETGSTYEENARGKALHGRATEPADVWVIGEDSGIEATALGGRPGIESARWDEDGVGRMLRELDGLDERLARYVCVIVALGPAGEELVAEGTLDGAIASAPAGDEGFGYDPIFVPRGEERTVAELGNDWKRRNSHRARAAARLAEGLEARTTG
jgi:XTP/dITP diphosphohydrolase